MLRHPLSVVNADDPKVRRVSVVGGRDCLIDMHVPHSGGPGTHRRRDFEEMFTLLEGEID